MPCHHDVNWNSIVTAWDGALVANAEIVVEYLCSCHENLLIEDMGAYKVGRLRRYTVYGLHLFALT